MFKGFRCYIMIISGWFTCFNGFNSFLNFFEYEVVGIDLEVVLNS